MYIRARYAYSVALRRVAPTQQPLRGCYEPYSSLSALRRRKAKAFSNKNQRKAKAFSNFRIFPFSNFSIVMIT